MEVSERVKNLRTKQIVTLKGRKEDKVKNEEEKKNELLVSEIEKDTRVEKVI